MGRKLQYKLQSGRPFTHFYSFFWLWLTGLYSCLTTWVTHFSKLSTPQIGVSFPFFSGTTPESLQAVFKQIVTILKFCCKYRSMQNIHRRTVVRFKITHGKVKISNNHVSVTTASWSHLVHTYSRTPRARPISAPWQQQLVHVHTNTWLYYILTPTWSPPWAPGAPGRWSCCWRSWWPPCSASCIMMMMMSCSASE